MTATTEVKMLANFLPNFLRYKTNKQKQTKISKYTNVTSEYANMTATTFYRGKDVCETTFSNK